MVKNAELLVLVVTLMLLIRLGVLDVLLLPLVMTQVYGVGKRKLHV
jgi:hypothetical protein